ncbi:hypothetical protein ACA910_022270 [Epithemia clementina (nom. ined.)]
MCHGLALMVALTKPSILISAFQQLGTKARELAAYPYPHRSALLFRSYVRSPVLLLAKPKRGSVVDSYQTVSVNCSKCGERLFRYKKKNGTKSNLIKLFLERIAEDSAGVLEKRSQNGDDNDSDYECPSCQTVFARPAIIRGLPALKFAGGKIRMSKK